MISKGKFMVFFPHVPIEMIERKYPIICGMSSLEGRRPNIYKNNKIQIEHNEFI